MDFEFDKEIDSLLRRSAKGESVQTFDAHMDADEISLFAENALATKARTRAAGHLAECAKCRKILSNVISFNAAAESETIHAGESEIVPPATAIPWYRRLFAFPQITYAMGALVLVFSGIIALMVLQTADDSKNVSVAQREEVRETTKGVSGASSDGETTTIETYSANTSNAASVNPGMAGNSNAATTTASNTANVSANSSTANVAPPVARQQPQAEKNEPVQTKRENSFVLDGQDASNAAVQNKPSITAGAPPSDAKQTRERAKDDSEMKLGKEHDAVSESQTAMRSAPSPKSMVKKSADADKNKAGEARAIGGKTFRSVGGIWFDSAYTSQPPVMIRRGSDDYKRLDSGLRSIAESLGGTVIILWKGKAYRIHP
ncbi:MAG TPA: hypothetical protein VGB00_01410 [Pyrinomonadaceae bacterium]